MLGNEWTCPDYAYDCYLYPEVGMMARGRCSTYECPGVDGNTDCKTCVWHEDMFEYPAGF